MEAGYTALNICLRQFLFLSLCVFYPGYSPNLGAEAQPTAFHAEENQNTKNVR